ncbi:hypothetical protein T03_741 [Trichinella britovi]|uniref:Uncharacterized protein n=1 Tax=Trichinella britovi TaxID=45882 RepID=A0A0V1DHH3_TRIBR|nr:hypothetical protein T03_741 [Trichinella britovi]
MCHPPPKASSKTAVYCGDVRFNLYKYRRWVRLDHQADVAYFCIFIDLLFCLNLNVVRPVATTVL